MSGTAHNFTAVSPNSSVGASVPVPDYGVVTGSWVLGGGIWVWTPFNEQKLARAISDAINLAYKNSDLTPTGADIQVQAQALYNKIYFEYPMGSENVVTVSSSTGSIAPQAFVPYNQSSFSNTGADTLLFGDRGSTASSTHLMNLDTIEPMRTIVIPLYVNRESGDLMPNTMEQQVDMGIGKYNENGTNITADWNVGDAEHGFGFSDYSNLNYLNGLTTTDNITKSLYSLPATLTGSLWKNSLIGNPITPVIWGGIDFDSANNNYIQHNANDYDTNIRQSASSINTDTYNGWSGKFTAPFASGYSSLATSSSNPRLSRLGGGLRGEYATGSIINGDTLSRTGTQYPFEGPASLSASAMTGIVLTHKATYPAFSLAKEGAETLATPTIGTNIPRIRNAKTCSHSFTIALTPMAQKFDPPKDSKGRRSSVGTILGERLNPLIDDKRVSDFGRYLDPDNAQNLVGNWLGEILSWAGIENTDGSSLPQGARVFLEVSTNLGNLNTGASNNGVWVGSVKCSFDVESNYGTAQTKIIKEE